MRRTYKSKKEIGGGLDPRDVILTMDSKSSIFDAFYIQNIKQTKREMSVNSNQSVASKKVRKRKYVKRIKEQQPLIQESSTSAYLTPDKSIRVNKAPDLFDQLLNSSLEKNSNEPVFSLNKTSEKSRRSKVNSKPRSYQRRKSLRKKINYSGSNDTDSDDFSSGENNKTKNMSNILRHELQIEKENVDPKPIDSSIDNLVNNLSLFNNNNRKAIILKESMFKNSTQSNSPLCSTPFISKYRGKSIYNFSPISINLNESAEAAKASEGSINGNEGSKDKSVITTDLKIYQKQSFHSNSRNKSLQNQITSPIPENKETNCFEKTENSKNNLLPIEILESTEIEPFLGFSNVPQTREVKAILNKYKDINDFSLRDQTNLESILISSGLNITEKGDKFLGFSKVAQDIQIETLNKYTDFDFSSTNQNNKESILIDSVLSMVEKEEKVTLNDSEYNVSVDNDSANSEPADDESLYDTCNSEDFEENAKKSHKKELVVVVEKLNDSIFQKFYDNIPENKEDIINTSNSEHCTSVDDTNLSIGEYECETGSLYDENDRVYKTGNETDTIDEINETGSNSDNTDEINETGSNSDNTDKINETGSNSDNTDEINETGSNSDNTDEINETNCDTYNIDEDNETESDSSDNKELEEEICVSFVTTRKRNCLSNNSFIFTLENSITSGSSADFEKTVLSNDATSQPNDMTITEIGVEGSNITDNITRVDNNKTFVESTDNEMLPISVPKDCESVRKSVRKSSLRPKRVSAPRKSTIDIHNETDNIVNNNISSRESTDSVVKCDYSKDPDNNIDNRLSICEARQAIVLQPGKRWERSLSIYRRMTTMADNFDLSILDEEPLDGKGRKYRQSVIATMELQDFKGSLHNGSIQSNRSTLVSKPHRSTIKIIRESNSSRASLCSTTILEDLQGYLTEDCDDTIIELSKLSIADSEHEVTILNNFHDTSNRIATARDYVLRRCNQADVILFDECYPDTVLKNCRKIGEGVYGEVFLWRAGDGRARVLKIVPIAGHVKVNGEEQKDYHEIISEIVIAMELSALRSPIPEIEKHLDEGKGVETLDLHSVVNATDVFNQVLAAHCVIGSYPSRLLDLWELYDETKGSENDNPAVLPVDQQFLVLELANAGQDLESYQFNNAEQAYALFQQIAFGLAVGEEAFQFEHRDLHWGNVLIAPTDQKYATFVLRGRSYRVARRGVSGTIIDYSLSRVSLPLGGDTAALYNDLSSDDALFDAVGDYQFQVYRLMRDKLGNDWKNFEPYTNILWLHYTVDKMITALRYTRTNTKIHKHYITKLKEIKNRILEYGSAVQYVLTDNEL